MPGKQKSTSQPVRHYPAQMPSVLVPGDWLLDSRLVNRKAPGDIRREWKGIAVAFSSWFRKPSRVWSIKAYLDNVREEQLKARVTPRQAEPILISDLAIISDHIEQALLGESNLSTIQIFVHSERSSSF